jgi:hypothetical protein
MRKSTTVILGAVFILNACLSSFGASTRLNLDFLKQETQVNLEFDYSDVKAGFRFKECVPEQEFVAKYVAELNAKIPAAGDTWKSEWPVQRVITWEPTFKNTLNKHLAEEKPPLEFGQFKSAKYTLILKIKVLILQQGKGLFITFAELTSEAVFVESSNRSNVLASIKYDRIVGRAGGVFYQYMEPDMSGAYWQTGKRLAILIKKKGR